MWWKATGPDALHRVCCSSQKYMCPSWLRSLETITNLLSQLLWKSFARSPSSKESCASSPQHPVRTRMPSHPFHVLSYRLHWNLISAKILLFEFEWDPIVTIVREQINHTVRLVVTTNRWNGHVYDQACWGILSNCHWFTTVDISHLVLDQFVANM